MKLSLKLLGRAALPVIAAGLIGFAVVTMDGREEAVAAPPAAPATAPAGGASVVAALGLVEPSSEVISVGSELPGIVREVYVKAGDRVAAGAPLFRLDGRALVASLGASAASVEQARANATASAARVAPLTANAQTARAGIALAEAGLATAQGNLQQAQGRLANARAAAQTARIAMNDANARYSLFTNVTDQRAISTDERDRARYAAEQARAAFAQAEAAVGEAAGGARAAEGGVQDAQARIAQARATTLQASASIAEAREQANASMAGARQAQAQTRVVATDLERLVVRAPIAGQILRLNVRLGEYASAGPLVDPLIALGEVDPLHVRVQIDEEDAARIDAGAPATASLRGDAARKVNLTFVRFEPQATPKKNLNGGAERVDTRVIEAIYAFNPAELPAFVGQQMDVFVTARPVSRPAVAPTPKTEEAR